MYLLPKNQYSKVQPLFEPFTHQLITQSVLAGNTIGDIYVDQTDAPRSAVMNGIVFEFLFAGDPGNKAFNGEIGELLEHKMIPVLSEKSVPYINLYYQSEHWKQTINREIVKNKKVTTVKKRFYTIDPADYQPPKKPLKENASLKLIDISLLNDPSSNNIDQVLLWIHVAWPSVDRFLENGIGYCVVEGNTIASWCLSLFSDQKHQEFGLMTDKAFQNKGYAKHTASACVRHCLDHGKLPLWNCDDHNTASVIVAESIGFKKTLDYDVFQIVVDSEEDE